MAQRLRHSLREVDGDKIVEGFVHYFFTAGPNEDGKIQLTRTQEILPLSHKRYHLLAVLFTAAAAQ